VATRGFGFSFNDLVQAIRILNDVHKVIQYSGGAREEFKHVLDDLQQLDILFQHLNYGAWVVNGDPGHLKAVRGMALTCEEPLQEFLTKIERYKQLVDDNLGGIKVIVEWKMEQVRFA
jgi:hypothetical protein